MAEYVNRVEDVDISNEGSELPNLFKEVGDQAIETVVEDGKKNLETVKNPTLTGMSNARDNLARAIQQNDPKDARETMLLLHAYGALGEEQKNRIYNALHALSFNGASLESYIKYKNYKDKDGKTTALGYAMALFLRSAGYIDKKGFEKAFGYDPVLEMEKGKGFSDRIAGEQSDELESAIDRYKQLLESRDSYLNKYTDRYVFSDTDNNALYDKLVSGSVSERDGWLLAARKLPLIKKLREQTSAPKDLHDLLDDNPNNNTQELMFLELYLLADSEIVPLSIQEDPRDNGLFIKPGALYEETLLGYVEKFINKENRTPEQLSYEDQLAALESTINRLVTAADVADPERKGKNIDQYLEYSVEKRILSLHTRISKKDEQMYEHFQNIVKTYITGYLFLHTTQTRRFAKLAKLLDAKNQKEILLAYAQLEPVYDNGLLNSAVSALTDVVELISPISTSGGDGTSPQKRTNSSDGEYRSPLAVGPTSTGDVKQFGDVALEHFDALSNLSLDELGELYSDLSQIIGGQKLDGTPWTMPIIRQAFQVVDTDTGLLEEHKKMLESPVSTDDTERTPDFVDPRLSFLFHVQDIYLMKLMESGDEASREKAVDFALTLAEETGGTNTQKIARDAFVEGIAGVVSIHHLTVDEKELTQSLEKAKNDLPQHIFGEFPEYASIKNKKVQDIVSGIDDTVFASLIGASKAEFVAKIGNKEFSKLTLGDQMLLFALVFRNNEEGGVDAIINKFVDLIDSYFDAFAEKNLSKILVFNEKGLSTKERKLFDMLQEKGSAAFDDLLTSPIGVQEAGVGGFFAKALLRVGKFATTKAWPGIMRFFKSRVFTKKNGEFFAHYILRPGGKIGGKGILWKRAGLAGIFGILGVLAEDEPNKDKIFDAESILKTLGIITSWPVGIGGKLLRDALGYGYDERFGNQAKVTVIDPETLGDPVTLTLNIKKALAFNPTVTISKESAAGLITDGIGLLSRDLQKRMLNNEIEFTMNGALVISIEPDYDTKLKQQIKEYKKDGKITSKGPLSINEGAGVDGEKPKLQIDPPKFLLFLAANMNGAVDSSAPPVIQYKFTDRPGAVRQIEDIFTSNETLNKAQTELLNSMSAEAQKEMINQLKTNPDYHEQLNYVYYALCEEFVAEISKGFEISVKPYKTHDTYLILALAEDKDGNGIADGMEGKGGVKIDIDQVDVFNSP